MTISVASGSYFTVFNYNVLYVCYCNTFEWETHQTIISTDWPFFLNSLCSSDSINGSLPDRKNNVLPIRSSKALTVHDTGTHTTHRHVKFTATHTTLGLFLFCFLSADTLCYVRCSKETVGVISHRWLPSCHATDDIKLLKRNSRLSWLLVSFWAHVNIVNRIVS